MTLAKVGKVLVPVNLLFRNYPPAQSHPYSVDNITSCVYT